MPGNFGEMKYKEEAMIFVQKKRSFDLFNFSSPCLALGETILRWQEIKKANISVDLSSSPKKIFIKPVLSGY